MVHNLPDHRMSLEIFNDDALASRIAECWSAMVATISLLGVED